MSKNSKFKHTYFIDRALGKSVGKALQDLGVKVEFHKNHFLPNSPDIEWLTVVSQKDWIILTKDTNIGRNILEIQAMAYSNAKVFTLISANLNSATMIDIFEKTIEKIDNFATTNPAPFIAKIYKNATVKLWKNNTKLKKSLKHK
jgi:predicted nuclease of predicted toxin-antitoxin system